MIFLQNRDDWIIRRCTGRKVLHLGCVDAPLLEEKALSGRLLHGKVLKVAKKAVGVDLDAAGISVLQRIYPDEEFVVANAESFSALVADDEYDIILAADVIEHVSNPGLLFDSAVALMKPHSELVVTTPSAFSAKKFCCALLTGREHNHPEHTFFYSPMTISRLASLQGLQVREMHSLQWQNPTWKNVVVNALARPLVWMSGNLTADELAVVLVRQNADVAVLR